MPAVRNDISEEEIFEVAVSEGTLSKYDVFEVIEHDDGPATQEYEIFIVASASEF